jgi:hypothetical protein
LNDIQKAKLVWELTESHGLHEAETKHAVKINNLAQDLDFIMVIGEGAYGKIILTEDKESNLYAVKTTMKAHLKDAGDTIE